MKKKLMYSCLILAVVAAAFCGACNTPQWVSEAQKEEPVIVSGINAVLAVYVTLDSNPADVAKANLAGSQVTGDLTLANSLITAFQAQASGTALQKIDAALNDAQVNLPAILAAVHVSDPASVAKADALVSIMKSEIQAIESEIPSAPASTTVKATPVDYVYPVAAASKPAQRKPLGARKLKSRLNKILKQKTGSKNDAKFQKAAVK